jgi:sporulation protein YlmC with PRC-barrel domain
VTTRGGVTVGTVANVAFEPPSYAFTQIEVSPGLFKTKTTIPIAQVISIGPEVLVVADEVAAEATPAATEPAA